MATQPMKSSTRRGMLWGAAIGVALITVAVATAFGSEEPPGGPGERYMGMSILLTQVGMPLSYALIGLIDAFGSESWLLSLALPLALFTVVVNWAIVGGASGWAAPRIARALRGNTEQQKKR